MARAQASVADEVAAAEAAREDELDYAVAKQALAAAESEAAQAAAEILISKQQMAKLLHASRSGEPGDHRMLGTERGELARLRGADVVDPYDETLRIAMARAGDAFDSKAASDTLEALKRAAMVGDAIALHVHSFQEARIHKARTEVSRNLVKEAVISTTGHDYDDAYFEYYDAYRKSNGLRSFRRPWDSLFTEYKPEGVFNGVWGLVDDAIEGIYGYTYTNFALTDTGAYTAYKQSFHESCQI